MKGMRMGLAAGLLMSQSAFGVTIAVIDSGTDINHVELKDRIWVNPGETPNNDADDDSNGKVDDINGWNFAKNNNELIDYKDEDSYTEDVAKFFDLQAKMIRGEATDEEIEWLKAAKEDEALIQKLQTFGNYAHGTHVTGISLADGQEIDSLGIKLIGGASLGALLPEATKEQLLQSKADDEIGPVEELMLKGALDLIAKNNAKLLTEIGTYVHSTKAQVANGSFGMSVKSVGPVVKQLLTTAIKNPTDDQVAEYSKYLINSCLKKMAGLVNNAPDTLFVFAAGNDGTDNDTMPTAPANIDAPNRISVAATVGNTSLASFSNFGANQVDIAAPGVGIDSTIPKDKRLVMSGTSQASPAVAHIAAEVRAANSNLAPEGVKEILMGTVDKKEWLAGKIKSGGVANGERAVLAARLAATMTVKEAIQEANQRVADAPEMLAFAPEALDLLFVAPLPSPL